MIAVTTHEHNLRSLRCVVSAKFPVTLHHCHGGSIKALGPEYWPGVGQRQNPFLQIPLSAEFHVGDYGIDYGMGVSEWEDRFGTQLAFLHEVNGLLSYDIFEEARRWSSEHSFSQKITA